MYYSNGFPSFYDEIKTYYPTFYFGVFEMEAIWRAHGKLADEVMENIDLAINNTFIWDADEATIERLEKFLWIETDDNRPLDERKRLVLSFFVGYGKISAAKIKEMVSTFTDAPCTVTFDIGDSQGNCYLQIVVERGDTARLLFADIDMVLRRKLPAHIAYNLALAYRFPVVTERKKERYAYDYDLCGTKPDIAFFGSVKDIAAITRESRTNAQYDYRAAAEDNPTGEYPEQAYYGALYGRTAATNPFTTAHQSDYTYCGTQYSQP